MLYTDSKKRIFEIIKQANLFHKNGYPKTAKEIYAFTKILEGNKIPSDFLKRLELTFDIFHHEFVNSLLVGQKYRKDVFQEVANTTLSAIGRMGTAYSQGLLKIYPLFRRLNEGKRITGQIGDELARNIIKDKNTVFHLYCYTYLVMVEGIFSELARILYFLTVISPNCVPVLKDLESMTVFDIRKKIGTTPVFLKKWDDKKHIRNAIGHARAYFDKVNDEVQFIDVHPKTRIIWDSGKKPLGEFIQMALELEDSIQAFLHIFILLKIFDFIVSKNPFQ